MIPYQDQYGAGARGLAGFDAQSAADYLAVKADEFFNLGPHIEDLQHTAATLAYQATQNGDVARADQLKAMIPALGDLRGEWDVWVGRWQDLRAQVPGLGVWIIPVAWAATVIAIAIAATVIFTKASTFDNALRMLQRGQLSPAQFDQVMKTAATDAGKPDIWSKLSQMEKTALIGVGLVVGYKVLALFVRPRGARA